MGNFAKIAEVSAWRVESGTGERRHEWIAGEAPLQIRLNGKPFSVTMRTPGDDEHLVRGLLFSDGIVRPDGRIESIDISKVEGVDTANVLIPEVYLCEQAINNQAALTYASCGYCGKLEFEAFGSFKSNPITSPIDATFIESLVGKMGASQPGFRASGGVHAAAVFTDDGDCLCLFEDVGRHNAVDKAIGHLLVDEHLAKACVLQVSGRVSFEIVNKACRAGIPVLSAISAPSSLAVKAAEDAGLTLIAFSRESRFTIYSHPQNISFKVPL